MVFSTCENVGDNFESLRGRFHRNGRIRPIGRLGVTFLIGRLRVNYLPNSRQIILFITNSTKNIFVESLNLRGMIRSFFVSLCFYRISGLQITQEIGEIQAYMRELSEFDINIIRRKLKNNGKIRKLYLNTQLKKLDGKQPANDRFFMWTCGLRENFEHKLAKFIEMHKVLGISKF